MRYTVHGTVTISTWTVVEADSEEEAIQIAESRETAQMSHQPCCDDEEDAWVISDLDGEVNGLTAERS